MAENEHFFTPESVDEQVERLLAQHNGRFPTEDEASRYLMKDLHHAYQAQVEQRQQTLESAWQRIQQRNRLVESPTEILPVIQGEPRRGRRRNGRMRYSQPLNMVAAVIVACLLIGSLLVVLNIARQGQYSSMVRPTATDTASTPVLPLQQGATVYTYPDSSAIYSVDWSQDSTRIISSGATVRIWDAMTGGHVVALTPAQVTGPFAARWSADNKFIATAASGLQIWNAATGNLVTSCPVPGNQTAIVPLKNSGSSAFFSYENSSGALQRVSAINMSLTDKETVPVNVAWSPDGKYVAFTDKNPAKPMVVVWDIPSCKIADTHPYKKDIPYDVKWSPDGKYLAVATSDRIVQVWEMGKNQPTYTYHDSYVTDIFSIAWSPDSKWIASTSFGSHKVEVWDALNGALIQEYSGHTAAVTSLTWSPDGKKIASGSSSMDANGAITGGEVQIWDVKTSQTLYTYHDHAHPVLAVAWSPNGKLIASAGGDKSSTSDGEVKVWVAG
jgi:Tol biopolymer transport system component